MIYCYGTQLHDDEDIFFGLYAATTKTLQI